jgi:cytochrome c2
MRDFALARKSRKFLHHTGVKAEDIHYEVTHMRQKALLFAVVLSSGLFVLAGQQPTQTRVFTSAQAEAGRKSYENTCGRCHTYSLHGRKGEAGELPPVSSLSEDDQKFIANSKHVPPLAGEAFLNRWGDKTVAQLIERFQVTVSDKSFKFKDIDDDTTVNITAYVLQVNGAKAGDQPLTRTTAGIVNTLVK